MVVIQLLNHVWLFATQGTAVCQTSLSSPFLRICQNIGFPGGSDGKGDLGLIPGWGRSPWESVWQPNPIFLPGEFLRAEEFGKLQSIGSQKVGHDWTTKHTQHVLWVGDSIQPSHPLSPFSPAALNLSQIRVFPSESALCIRWPKYWSFSINSSNEYSGLILGWTGLISLLSKGPWRVF